MKIISQDSRSPGRDLNPGPPKYEAGVLTTRHRRLTIMTSKVTEICPWNTCEVFGNP
jgi:hypothetical protein